MIVIHIAKYIGKYKTAPFCTTLGLLDTPVRMPTSLRYNFRRFLVEDSIKGNLTSVIAETFVFHHRWNHVTIESSGKAFFKYFLF